MCITPTIKNIFHIKVTDALMTLIGIAYMQIKKEVNSTRLEIASF